WPALLPHAPRSSPPEAPYAAPAASPRPLASLHPWQTTRRPSPCPSGPPLLVVASQPADEGAPPFGSGILTNSWAHIGLHPWPQLREPSTPPVCYATASTSPQGTGQEALMWTIQSITVETPGINVTLSDGLPISARRGSAGTSVRVAVGGLGFLDITDTGHQPG